MLLRVIVMVKGAVMGKVLRIVCGSVNEAAIIVIYEITTNRSSAAHDPAAILAAFSP